MQMILQMAGKVQLLFLILLCFFYCLLSMVISCYLVIFGDNQIIAPCNSCPELCYQNISILDFSISTGYYYGSSGA